MFIWGKLFESHLIKTNLQQMTKLIKSLCVNRIFDPRGLSAFGPCTYIHVHVYITNIFLSSNPKGGGHIGFGADPCPRPCWFFPGHYLLNQRVDFDQTCIETLLAGGKEPKAHR